MFAPDVRVRLNSKSQIIGFELLSLVGAQVFLNTRHDGILGQDFDTVQRVMAGITFEIHE